MKETSSLKLDVKFLKVELLDVSIIDLLLVEFCCCVMIPIVFEQLCREQSGTIFGCKIKIPMRINLIAICLGAVQ